MDTGSTVSGGRVAGVVAVILGMALSSGGLAHSQAPTAAPTPTTPTIEEAVRPPTDNASTMRPLSANEIPPNLSFYAIDPLYTPGVPLGWAATRIEETLDRGLDAQPIGPGRVYLSWRLLKTDAATAAFDVFRQADGGAPVKISARPVRATTDFTDGTAPRDRALTYWVLSAGAATAEAPIKVSVPAGAAARPYHAIQLRDDVKSVDRVGIGDLNGDGSYDFVVKHPSGTIDPGRVRPSTDTYKLDGYDGRTGRFLWRVDLGWNINHGIWFSPMVVRDLDGDGRAEVAVRGAPYAATQAEAFDGGKGFVLDGPESLVVYDGATGKEIASAPWIERGKPTEWADYSGNRSSRHMLGVAYLDGKTPSLLVVRGTYGLMRVDAWTLQDKKLRKLWRWTNERAPFKYQGQGQHSIKTGDIDGDGKDEILNGSIAIDHDGRTLWSTGMGHGDRFYLSDIDPRRPGLEIWYTLEDPHPQNGVSLWDAKSGALLFGTPEAVIDNQVAGGLAGDIDPAHPGMELWGDRFFYSAAGQALAGPPPPQNELVWWDADPLRELHSRGHVSKWKGAELATTEGSVQHVADITGDWREEIVTFAGGALRIYATPIPAIDRRVCLMQDPLYRNDVTHRSMGYPHVPMTSYYLGAPVAGAGARVQRAR
ncbi:MAG: silent information regulator protein Sir2 [Vicinamibacteraceae bacterium]